MASSLDMYANAATSASPLSTAGRRPSPLPAPVWGSSAVDLNREPCETAVQEAHTNEDAQASEAQTSKEAMDCSPGRVVEPAPELRGLVDYTLTIIVEVLDGRRPIGQLQRIARRDVASLVDRRRVLAERMRARMGAEPLPNSRILEKHSQCPMADVIEVAASVRHSGRVRAVCLRFELNRSKWQLVHFSMA